MLYFDQVVSKVKGYLVSLFNFPSDKKSLESACKSLPVCAPWACSLVSLFFRNVCSVSTSKSMSGWSQWPSLHSHVTIITWTILEEPLPRLVCLICHLIHMLPRPQWWQHLSQPWHLSFHLFQVRNCSSALWEYSVSIGCLFLLHEMPLKFQ